MKPFLSGRTHVTATTLQPVAGLGAAEAVARAASNHAHAGAAPAVEIIKEGDKIVRLVVTCTCGERIEIDCVYPAGI